VKNSKKFYHNIHLDIYQDIWKLRSEKRKERKLALGIRRNDFTTLKRKRARPAIDDDQHTNNKQSFHTLVRNIYIETPLMN
jgi:hypothetical protein